MATSTSHLVIVSGNDSAFRWCARGYHHHACPDPGPGNDFQRSSVDRFIEVPEISAESLIELLRPIHETTPVTALACFLESAILAAATAADALSIPSNPSKPSAPPITRFSPVRP